MIKILFICHGNICRSPMGEFILKDMAEKAGVADRFEIASAAVTDDALGCAVYRPAREELAKHGIDCSGKTARKMTESDLDYYDQIYYMDDSNWRYLCWLFGKKAEKCTKLLRRDVADPWYTDNFERTWIDLVEGCQKILEANGV